MTLIHALPVGFDIEHAFNRSSKSRSSNEMLILVSCVGAKAIILLSSSSFFNSSRKPILCLCNCGGLLSPCSLLFLPCLELWHRLSAKLSEKKNFHQNQPKEDDDMKKKKKMMMTTMNPNFHYAVFALLYILSLTLSSLFSDYLQWKLMLT